MKVRKYKYYKNRQFENSNNARNFGQSLDFKHNQEHKTLVPVIK